VGDLLFEEASLQTALSRVFYSINPQTCLSEKTLINV
jgi:hypothetical protein